MAMNADQRRNAKYHCGPGDSFPIDSESDAHDAWMLAGHAANAASVRACVRRVAKENNWTLPKTAMTQMSMGTVTFEDEETVVRSGKILEVGYWDHARPEQRVEFSEDDADRAVREFQPVYAEIEHFYTNERPSIFDGQIGRLQRIWKEGKVLFGEMRVPKFVDGVWGRAGRKVSVVLDPEHKTIIRCGLVLSPRVPDAVMMSASDEGDDEQTAPADAALAGAYAQQFAQRGPDGAPQQSHKENHMEKQAQGSGETTAAPPPPSGQAVEFAQRAEALEAQNQSMIQELAQLRAERRMERARTRVTELVSGQHKLPPAQFAAAVAVLAQAYQDDERTPVQFAATEGGTQRNRADNLLAIWQALPTAILMGEQTTMSVLGFSAETDPAKNPLSPEGADAGARTWAEARNGRK